MKLKELPSSLWRAWQLKKIPVEQLHASATTDVPVIVSLTSIPSRLKIIHLTLRSLLSQSAKPQKVVLWLNEDLQNKLPQSLLALIGPKFEIHFVEGNYPHRKLIHSLKAFPELPIVTCDDDVMYDWSWLEHLYRDHLRYPKDIIGNECRVISYDAQEQVMPYAKWPYERGIDIARDSLLPIGYAGVLYPPNSLHSDVFQRDVFLKLAPRSDDLWFKVMSYRNATQVRRASHPCKIPIPIAGSQKISLKKTNVRQDGNSTQWKALVEYFHLPVFKSDFEKTDSEKTK